MVSAMRSLNRKLLRDIWQLLNSKLARSLCCLCGLENQVGYGFL